MSPTQTEALTLTEMFDITLLLSKSGLETLLHYLGNHHVAYFKFIQFYLSIIPQENWGEKLLHHSVIKHVVSSKCGPMYIDQSIKTFLLVPLGRTNTIRKNDLMF